MLQYAPAQHAAPVPVGQLFSFEISYDASVPSFGFKVDDTALPNFVLPANTGPIPFSELHVVGAVDIQFMGAPLTGITQNISFENQVNNLTFVR